MTRRETQAVKKPDVDPAALLIAIIAVAISPLTTIGPWDRMNTVVALVVLIVLWAYTIGGHRRDSLGSFVECAAIGLVVGLIFAILMAWPIQFFWTGIGKSNKDPRFVAADDSTWSGLLLGLVVAIVLTIFLWKKHVAAKERTVPRAERSAPPLYKKKRESSRDDTDIDIGADFSMVATERRASPEEPDVASEFRPSGNK